MTASFFQLVDIPRPGDARSGINSGEGKTMEEFRG
jgi:hypothetical protein